MSFSGPVSLVLFWLVAPAAGSALVLLVLDGGFGWLVLTVPAAIAVAPIGAARARRRR